MWTNVTLAKIQHYVQNNLYVNPKRFVDNTRRPIGSIRREECPYGNRKYSQTKIKTHDGWVDYDRYKYDIKDDEVIIRKDPNKFIESHDDFIIVPKYVLLEIKKRGIDDEDLIKSYTLISELKKQLELYGG